MEVAALGMMILPPTLPDHFYIISLVNDSNISHHRERENGNPSPSEKFSTPLVIDY